VIGITMRAAMSGPEGKNLTASIGKKAHETRRVENRDELHAEIESVFSGLSSEEVVERLEGAGVANARMRTVRQFLDHPQLEARNRWREFGSPVGPLRGLLPPATLDGAEPVMFPVPEVGEHNEKLLAELGYGETRDQGSSGGSSSCSGSLLKEPSKRLPS
jgi:crotonobetainyl-CoA:carnitine CoA-transferase CaiB-like acyl-CoA transferase